jgi:hypothetical protein
LPGRLAGRVFEGSAVTATVGALAISPAPTRRRVDDGLSAYKEMPCARC